MSMKRYESRLYPVYCEHEDLTFVMREEYDSCTGEVVTLEVTGFYYGRPDSSSTKEFNGKRKATFIV
jgi:hypothetical protein